MRDGEGEGEDEEEVEASAMLRPGEATPMFPRLSDDLSFRILDLLPLRTLALSAVGVSAGWHDALLRYGDVLTAVPPTAATAAADEDDGTESLRRPEKISVSSEARTGGMMANLLRSPLRKLVFNLHVREQYHHHFNPYHSAGTTTLLSTTALERLSTALPHLHTLQAAVTTSSSPASAVFVLPPRLHSLHLVPTFKQLRHLSASQKRDKLDYKPPKPWSDAACDEFVARAWEGILASPCAQTTLRDLTFTPTDPNSRVLSAKLGGGEDRHEWHAPFLPKLRHLQSISIPGQISIDVLRQCTSLTTLPTSTVRNGTKVSG
jgi:hypothetical protein